MDAQERVSLAGRPPWRAALDADRLGDAVVLRAAAAGDRFVPLGARGETPVEVFLSKQRLPGALRRGVRVAAACGELVEPARGEIAWVLGQRVDARYAITPATARVALLEAEPIGP